MKQGLHLPQLPLSNCRGQSRNRGERGEEESNVSNYGTVCYISDLLQHRVTHSEY